MRSQTLNLNQLKQLLMQLGHAHACIVPALFHGPAGLCAFFWHTRRKEGDNETQAPLKSTQLKELSLNMEAFFASIYLFPHTVHATFGTVHASSGTAHASFGTAPFTNTPFGTVAARSGQRTQSTRSP